VALPLTAAATANKNPTPHTIRPTRDSRTDDRRAIRGASFRVQGRAEVRERPGNWNCAGVGPTRPKAAACRV
jgi:hypothetical protein